MAKSSPEQPMLPGMEKRPRRTINDVPLDELFSVGAPAPGHEETYAEGLEAARQALEASRLGHPNDTKTVNMKAALAVVAEANQAGGLATILEAGPTNPHYDDVSRYYGGESQPARSHESLLRGDSGAIGMIERACGACALSAGCIFNGNPGALSATFRNPEVRKGMAKAVHKAEKAIGPRDFFCPEIVSSDANQGHQEYKKQKRLNK